MNKKQISVVKSVKTNKNNKTGKTNEQSKQSNTGNKKKINKSKPKKNRRPLFRKKKIRIPSINKLDNLVNNIEKILKYDEKIIIKYLERIIFTSILSETTHKQLKDIFKDCRIDL